MPSVFTLCLIIAGFFAPAIDGAQLTHSVVSWLTPLYFSFLEEPTDEYTSTIGPRYASIDSYLFNWKRKIFLYGTASVPPDIIAAVSSIVRYRTHLNTLSKIGLLSDSDERFIEFLDEQSLWLSNNMGLLDSVDVSDLETTRDYLRERLVQVALRMVRYLSDKEAMLKKQSIALHPAEVAVIGSLVRMRPTIATEAKVANFEPDKLTNAWKTHSILPALHALNVDSNPRRFAYAALRDRYRALAQMTERNFKTAQSPEVVKNFWFIREQLAKLSKPSDQALDLCVRMDKIIAEFPESVGQIDVDKLARRMATIRAALEDYVSRLPADLPGDLEQPMDIKTGIKKTDLRQSFQNAVNTLRRIEPNEISLEDPVKP